jgi:hypothetical protein
VAIPYPQTPAPRSRPRTVTISSYLLYLVAGVELITAIMGLSVIGRMSRIVDDAYSGTVGSAGQTLIVGGAVFGAVIDILFGAGLTILAIFNNRGKQGSRITTWVIGGLALCCNGFGVLGSGANFSGRFDPGTTGGPSSTDVERQINDALPSWYSGTAILLASISVLALLAVIVLLAMPASNAFFRKFVTGGWDPSQPYTGATPYGAYSPYPYAAQPPYPGQPYPGQPYPGQQQPPPYPGQQPPPYQGQPQYPPYPGQPAGEPATPPPGSVPPVSGAPGSAPPAPPAQPPHTGSFPPADPWNPPHEGDRPPSDPPSQA